MMDVEEMIDHLNKILKTSSTSVGDMPKSSEKLFSLLEVKRYLQQLHDEGRIFMVWDDGKMGIIYQI